MTRKKRVTRPRAHRASGKYSDEESPYFLSVSVANARCFDESKQTLDVSDGNGRPARWTLILGENGTGKTTLLQCFVASEPLFLSDPDGSLWRFHRAFFWPKDGTAYDLSRTQHRPFVAAWFAHGSRLSAQSGTFASIGSQFIIGPPTNFDASRALQKVMASAPEGRVSDIVGSVPLGPICYGYGVTRRSGVFSLAADFDDSRTESLFRDDAALRNAEEWILQLDYAASKDEGAPNQWRKQRDHVRELLVSILPDVQDVRTKFESGTQPRPQVVFQTPYGWVPLRQLGYGYQSLIAWMVDFASRMVERYPDSKDPLAEPAVVLVDEIDLHMHPTWQRKLMGYLSERFPNTQFIATAHSPLIVQAATEDTNIAVLRREGDHVVIDNDVDVVKGWRIDQILTSDLFDLPTARPPEYDKMLAERTKLLSKARLTKTDKKRLAELEAQIQLPAGESLKNARETKRLIEEAVELVDKYRDKVS